RWSNLCATREIYNECRHLESGDLHARPYEWPGGRTARAGDLRHQVLAAVGGPDYILGLRNTVQHTVCDHHAGELRQHGPRALFRALGSACDAARIFVSLPGHLRAGVVAYRLVSVVAHIAGATRPGPVFLGTRFPGDAGRRIHAGPDEGLEAPHSLQPA